MARVDTLVHFLTDVADSIRAKKGTSGAILAENFDTEIASISSGGVTPTKGFTIDSWDSDGYATSIKIYGLTSLPDYAFKFHTTLAYGTLFTKIQSFDFNNVVTSLGFAALQSNSQLTEIKNWGSLTRIGKYGLANCTSFNPKILPDSVTYLDDYAFIGNTGMTQLSMNNVTTINGYSNNAGAFNGCTGLKAVWLGSAIYYIYRYSFQGCTSLQKMYIDLPRATVEAKTGYPYAFMNDNTKTGIIVCNDDEGFITKEQFDATDWSSV